MKYIDADQIRAEIDRRYEENRERARYDDYYRGMNDGLDHLEQFLDTIPEQPECHTVEDWMQHIKNADQLTKDIFSKGPYDVLYDALNHPYQHCYDAIKEFGELCFQTGVNSVKPKQPVGDIDGKAMLYVAEKSYKIGLRDGKAGKEQPVEKTSYDTQKYTPSPSVSIEDVARVQFASHAKVLDKKRKAVFDWEQFKEVVSIFYGFGKNDSPETKEKEQPVEYPTSTEMITEWENTELPMLREKDFRGDAERMAYNAFLDGFAKGLGYKK